MADMLASPEDLRDLLGEDDTSLPDTQAMLLLEIATAEVQAAAGQRLVEVSGDQVEVMGTTEAWLALPQRPVTNVNVVEVDGESVTDYQRHGARLWRGRGWAAYIHRPSTVSVTYTHGYAIDAPALGLARKLTLSLAARLYANPSGATGFSIDDYREQYPQTTDGSTGTLPRSSRDLLRRTYGVRTGLVRIG